MNLMDDDVRYMRLAIKEAKKGLGRTSPNPCVGAVIVKNGEILSKGYHKKSGTPHAEINAINNAQCSVAGATIYVTLEPCSHRGRTGPCCEAIVQAGISRVVIGMIDPNPLVDGKGIEFCKNKGLSVESGLLTEECEAINYPFLKYITTGRPWMIMKAGVSLDGRLCYKRGESGWITGEKTLRAVHRQRDRVDAILLGSNSVIIDNPSLTTRLPGRKTKDPVRVILDSKLTTPLTSRVYTEASNSSPTWVICSDEVRGNRKRAYTDLGVGVLEVNRAENGLDLTQVVKSLGEKSIYSVLVEGGGAIHGAFLKARLYDYICLFYGPLFAGSQGTPLTHGFCVANRNDAPKLLKPKYRRLGDDLMVEARIVYPSL